jgi:hypothetical protein
MSTRHVAPFLLSTLVSLVYACSGTSGSVGGDGAPMSRSDFVVACDQRTALDGGTSS